MPCFIIRLQARIQELEKDLYYYKTTSRELKKKLREMSGSQESDKQVRKYFLPIRELLHVVITSP